VEQGVLHVVENLENKEKLVKCLRNSFKISEVHFPIATWFASLSLAFEKSYAEILKENRNNKEDPKNLLPS
jgi:hypothetical protein